MRKKPSWRIGIARTEFYMIDVEAFSEAEAIELAYLETMMEPDDHITGITKAVTSVFINDKACKGFAPYVHEYFPDKSLSEESDE